LNLHNFWHTTHIFLQRNRILATVGVAYVVKRIMHSKEGCCMCGCHKVEDENSTSETESHKTKESDENRTGSRYGSNPIRY
jgi:hypothetical protein